MRLQPLPIIDTRLTCLRALRVYAPYSSLKHTIRAFRILRTFALIKRCYTRLFLVFLQMPLCLSVPVQKSLTLSWRRPISYRKQSTDLLRKSMDWFLYDISLRHERVNKVRNDHGNTQRWEFSVLDRKHPFWTNLTQKIKVVSRSWNLVPRTIWSKKSKLSVLVEICYLY